ncbi:D-glycero-beta-D-manno-heptose 1-phosphate adenylyltransferase [Desulfobacterales bacterium HSG16]|nr:D-glycero-beta-D-manno-heptose 1-phosphate adenylyltransferase [Desulfobacterales bacterium HSG16]
MISRLYSPDELKDKLEPIKASGRKIVFTNGCFDILHAGHVRYLTKAREAGDVLVIGLNSDKSVRAIKGDTRPVVDHNHRAEVLAGLRCVDYICIFDEPDPSKLIRIIKPDVLVKGADWSEDEIIGGDFVKEQGGIVRRISLVNGISTSEIIRRIMDSR